jgi:hypothetical protein
MSTESARLLAGVQRWFGDDSQVARTSSIPHHSVAGRDVSSYHDLEGDSMMTEALERAFKQAERLPEQEQQELARVIQQALSDMCWEDLLTQPATARFLRELEQEADDESALEDLATTL